MKSTIEWHSVDEMLPERKGLTEDETEYVLVRYACNNPILRSGFAYVTICGYDAGGFSRFDSFGLISPKLITHWAYLPNADEGFD